MRGRRFSRRRSGGKPQGTESFRPEKGGGKGAVYPNVGKKKTGCFPGRRRGKEIGVGGEKRKRGALGRGKLESGPRQSKYWKKSSKGLNGGKKDSSKLTREENQKS